MYMLLTVHLFLCFMKHLTTHISHPLNNETHTFKTSKREAKRHKGAFRMHKHDCVKLLLWVIAGPPLPICNIRLFSMLQSHFDLGRTYICPHHRGKVFGQQHRALSWATTHIHCQLKGMSFLSKLYGIAVILILTHALQKFMNQLQNKLPQLHLHVFPKSQAPAVLDDQRVRSCTSSRKKHAACLQTDGEPWLVAAPLNSCSYIWYFFFFFF